MKRLIGFISAVLGMAGTVLCLAIIAGIWVFKSNLLASGINPLAPADTAFGLLETAMQQTTELIDDTQNKLRSGDPASALAEVATSINQTQSQVAVARQTLTTLHQFISSFHQLLDLVGATRLHTLSTGLDSKLKQFQEAFQEIGELAERIGNGRGGSINQLSTKLDQLQTRVNTVLDGVDKGQATLSELHDTIPKIIFLVALGLTLLLLWLALGQWLIARWGWRRLLGIATIA